MASPTIWEAARRYLASGFSVIPCKYKKPMLKSWEYYQTQRPKLHEINYWFGHEERGQSIGLVLGAISHNVVVVDLDGWASVRLFQINFPHLLNTFSVMSGSLSGLHLYYRLEALPQNMSLHMPLFEEKIGIEIRGNGQYVIAPPSPHLSGNNYRVQNRTAIMNLENLSELVAWLEHLRGGQTEGTPALVAAAAKPVHVQADRRKQAYLAKVLSEELARVETSGNGNRNNSLYFASMRLANFAAGGELNWQDCEMRLLAAALSVGTPEGEARRTIASAWKTGSKHPKKVK